MSIFGRTSILVSNVNFVAVKFRRRKFSDTKIDVRPKIDTKIDVRQTIDTKIDVRQKIGKIDKINKNWQN